MDNGRLRHSLAVGRKMGGEILQNANYKYWQEVYYHGDANPQYKPIYLDILNLADKRLKSL